MQNNLIYKTPDGQVTKVTSLSASDVGKLNTALSDVQTLYGTTATHTSSLNNLTSLVDFLETFRKSWIGVVRLWRSTTIPVGFAAADGSFVSFANYPELKEVYNAGGFNGMLLAYNASDTDKANYLGKWRPNAATPTGLYMPNYNGKYAKLSINTYEKIGGTLVQSLPNITGGFKICGGSGGFDSRWGAFNNGNTSETMNSYTVSGTYAYSNAGDLNASRSNSTYGAASTVNPPAIESIPVIYLGKYVK